MVNTLLTDIYYNIKPCIPRRLQILIRKKHVQRKRHACLNEWPINEQASKPPSQWTGWPQKKQFAFVLSHDVETDRGHDKCYALMEREYELGFRSSFNFVPKRYNVSEELRNTISDNGFEIGVHGLYHDGKLYKSKREFQSRAVKINHYLKEWKAEGFCSPSMHNNLEWIHYLNIKYDSSTFDTDPFEPRSEGVRTIFPFWEQHPSEQGGYVELPYTLPQDFTLFVLMEENTIDVWKQKLDWIAEKGGMALVTTHPDYMRFREGSCKREEYPIELYEEFLLYVKNKYGNKYWHPLPKDMAHFWEKRYRKQTGEESGQTGDLSDMQLQCTYENVDYD